MKLENLKKSITKAEVNELPIMSFEGEIQLIIDLKSCLEAIEELKKETILGFDTECRPSFKKGESYSISLLQLSTMNKAYLFRLNKFSFPSELSDLLADPSIKKAGVAVRDDIIGLQKIRSFKAKGFEEIADQAKALGIKNLGLRSLAAILYDGRISKRAKLTNWENNQLSEAQIKYAATDAWLGVKLYCSFLNLLAK